MALTGCIVIAVVLWVGFDVMNDRLKELIAVLKGKAARP
jgi:hypothetical protein